MSEMFKQNSFSRSLYNDQKMGAYYTDVSHCRRIGNLFAFPEEDVCVLEPSIGDAEAVLAVTGKNTRNNIKLFGVELNPNTCKELEEAQKCDYLLNADFLNGIKVSHNSFSFCFSNPPYGVAQDEHKRLETLFVDKMANYITVNGLLALVIPYYVLTDESFLKTFFKWFQPLAQFKFDDMVYERFKQIVVIGMKRRSIGYIRNTYDEYLQSIDTLDKLPYLPTEDDELTRIQVKPSSESKVEFFTTLTFDKKKAAEHLVFSPLYREMTNRVFVPSYRATDLGRPPVPLKKDLLYLCAIAGGGQGLVGNEERKDLHLQRGVVKTVITEDVDAEGNIVQRKSAKISLNIIQNDGAVTVLE